MNKWLITAVSAVDSIQEIREAVSPNDALSDFANDGYFLDDSTITIVKVKADADTAAYSVIVFSPKFDDEVNLKFFNKLG